LFRRAAFCIVLVAAAGCRRSTGPDENYQKASSLYQQLYLAEFDDAYGDSRMDEVVALLKKVDGRSVDAPAAQTMLGAIQHGREALAKARAEGAKRDNTAAAVAAPSAGASIDPSEVLAAGASPEDAGVQDPYGPGASVAELNTQSGGCLVDNEPFNEQVTGVTGTVYRVAPSDVCKGKLPGMVGQAVLVTGGKIYRRVADPRPPPPAAPPAASPDAGPAAAAARPRPAAAADAGEPQYQMYIPGAPRPGSPPSPPPEGQQQ
jgi:hypothetical protein